MDYLIISFDGKKQNHEKGRSKGSFKKVMRAFEECKNNNIKVLTNTVLNKYNLNDIDYILDTVKRYGFMSTFNLLQGVSDYYPSDTQYERVLTHLIKQKKQGAPIVLSLKTMNFLRNWSDYKEFTKQKEIKGFNCWAGELICNIDTDGKIAACDILTHRQINNPDCLELGFEKAFRSITKKGCKACTCSHVIEYNYMLSLNLSVIVDWGKLIFKRGF